MGRKSSAKTQARPSPGGPPPSDPRRNFTPLLAIALVAIVIVVVFAFTRGDTPESSAANAPTQPAAPAVVDPPPSAAFGPRVQENLPPIPFEYGPPARPAEVVRAVYKFAAEHPEVLAYTPCYCGCEREGHRGNDDCFVKARDARGRPTEWEEHGLG